MMVGWASPYARLAGRAITGTAPPGCPAMVVSLRGSSSMHRNPETLSQTVGATHDGAAWLRDLPERIAERAELWALSLGAPIEHEASCSWVAPCTTASGEQAVWPCS
jgi:ABC-type nitrate/sulfonate/bicarbonate transport system substrate-binding protein